MAQRIDPRYCNVFIDAHMLDKADSVDNHVDELLALHPEPLLLQLTHSVKAEIEHPTTPDDVKQRAGGLIYTMPVTLTEAELMLHQEIRGLLRGNATAGKHDSDAYHVVEASKHGGYFVTLDERIIKKRPQIRKRIGQGFDIVTPLELLALLHADH